MEEKYMATAKDVAELFLSWANRDGDLITNLKMQKLLYYAHAWYLVNFNGKPLFDDIIEAWNLGPVVPNIYQLFKRSASKPIAYKNNNNEEKVFTSNQIAYLKEFYLKYIGFSAHELVNMSHNEKPWKDTYEEGVNNIISNSLMRSYYSGLLKKANG
jgi:uncharacterized phage-associated protein